MSLIAQVSTTILGFIEARDHGLMRRINGWPAPRWFRMWMIYATRGGDGWLWYLLAIGIVTFGGPERFRALGASALAVAVGIQLFLLIKKTTGRKRPCTMEPHCWATLLPPDQFSFPSGHTMTAFAFSVPMMMYYPDLAVGLFFCAASIAISRVVLGMHFLSDVLAGGVLGSAIGWVAFSLVS